MSQRRAYRGSLAATDVIRRREFCVLARKQVKRAHVNLFHELTGLRFHLNWSCGPTSHPGSFEPGEPLHPSNGRSRPLRGAASSRSPGKPWCGNGSGEGGDRWIPIVVDGITVGAGFVRPPGNRRLRAPSRRDRGQGKQAGKDSGPRRGLAKGRGPVRRLIARAMRLLRFLVRFIEAAVHSEVAQRERARAEQEASEHRHRAAGLRADLARALPAINAQPSQRQAGSRREEIVRRMLAFVHANYEQPLTLQRCADELALNAAYVCTLFSRTVGLPFKTYLTRLRIERARELLSDPLRRVSEVAFAVGYADVDRFRAAFIAATGQPPTTWRNALRVEVAPPC